LLDDAMRKLHQTWPKATQSLFIKPVLAILPLTLVFGLTGCGGGTGVDGGIPKPTMAVTPGMINTENIAAPKLLGIQELEGLTRTNPFTPLLIDPNQQAIPDDPTLPEQPQTPLANAKNPFNGYTLNGIIYMGKRPTAILSLPDNKTKVVHQGDTLASADDANSEFTLKVSKITKDSLTLEVIDPPETLPPDARSTTLSIPTLVGYKGKSKESTASKATGNAADLAEAEAPPLSGLPPELQNLLKEDSKGNLAKPEP
jgi:hypothetical protein